jgi:hypothetical protein
MKDKPYPTYTANDEEYETEMERLTDLYPVPDNYNVLDDVPKDKKRKKTEKKGRIGYTVPK